MFPPHPRTSPSIAVHPHRTPRSRRASNRPLNKLAIVAEREIRLGEVEALVRSTGSGNVVVAAEVEAAGGLT